MSLDMTVREFIELCRSQGLHFTAHWVLRRVNSLDKERSND